MCLIQDFTCLCVPSVRARARGACINAQIITEEEHVQRDLTSQLSVDHYDFSLLSGCKMQEIFLQSNRTTQSFPTFVLSFHMVIIQQEKNSGACSMVWPHGRQLEFSGSLMECFARSFFLIMGRWLPLATNPLYYPLP